MIRILDYFGQFQQYIYSKSENEKMGKYVLRYYIVRFPRR